ncbi:proprotein convertase subtilisin/kexin type 6-like [Mytilus edulis]|uniref:proprotein convertase subtilisin/kexin type 6-like n=1 Tax=Mytilus edulis TaxID=6550 RepID=UPI0039EE6CFF
MNVLPAWRSCVNGSGVTVGVVDKGVQDHTDLNINRNLDYGKRQSVTYWADQLILEQNRQNQQRWRYGYNRQPQQRWNSAYNIIQRRKQESLKHGTRVAGIVAAKQNRLGIVGIAFGAEIADISSALNQKSALEYGTTYGRGRLGSVYVFATGNSGGEETDVFRDSCSYDRLVTNRYVISVAGIQHNLQKLPNGEACSAMMVAAFTAKAGANSYQVETKYIGNRNTTNFNQNSAAAPMVSGAVALALSANPALTYRDIMHLLVQTSRSDLQGQAYQSKFFTNAANIKVSSYFGFGLLDIGNLVERSKTWKNVPRKESCRSITTYNKRLTRDSIVVQVTQCSVSYIEHVEVSLKVNHRHAGQIKWVLVSPHGTKSTILPGRGLDPTTEMDITVLTVQLWGENPIGYWTLEPTAVFGKSLGYGTVELASLLIHGYACRSSVDECLPPAEQDRPSSTVRSLPEQVDGTQDVGSSLMTGRRRGECPSHLTASCVEQCSSDSDCLYYQKCCNNGCGHTCDISSLYQGSWSSWSQWSGCSVTCGGGTRSRRRQCYLGYCSGERYESRQCNNRECQNEGHYERRSGECPSHLTSSCVEQCSTDRDCLYYQKCCHNGCGHTCESRTYRPSTTVRSRPVQECSDRYEGCSRLAINNGCIRNGIRYMTYHCRRTCDYC